MPAAATLKLARRMKSGKPLAMKTLLITLVASIWSISAPAQPLPELRCMGAWVKLDPSSPQGLNQKSVALEEQPGEFSKLYEGSLEHLRFRAHLTQEGLLAEVENTLTGTIISARGGLSPSGGFEMSWMMGGNVMMPEETLAISCGPQL